MEQDNQQHPTPPLSANQQVSETVSELVHRHLKDANHIITDDEIRNAKIELYKAPEDGSEDIVRRETGKEKDSPVTEGEKDTIITPQDVTR